MKANNHDKALNIVSVDEDIFNEAQDADFIDMGEEAFRELFKRYYEIEITRLDNEYAEISTTIH